MATNRDANKYIPGLGKTMFIRDTALEAPRVLAMKLSTLANGTVLTPILTGKTGRIRTLTAVRVVSAVKPASAGGTVLFRLFKHPAGGADVDADDGNNLDLEGGTAKEARAVTLAALATSLKLNALGDSFLARVISNNADMTGPDETHIEIEYTDAPSS